MRFVSLRRAGVQVVLDVTGPYLPRIPHWGADLGAADFAALPGAAYEPPARRRTLPTCRSRCARAARRRGPAGPG